MRKVVTSIKSSKNDQMKFCGIYLIFSIVLLFGFCESYENDDDFTNDFAIELRGAEDVAARTLTERYGLSYINKVLNVHHFKHETTLHRSKRSADSLVNRLKADPLVVRVTQQRSLVRVKRGANAPRKVLYDKQREISFPIYADKTVFQRYPSITKKSSMIKVELDTEPDMNFNDKYYPDQWYLRNRGQTGGPLHYDLNVVRVWLKGITGSGINICVLDDGIDHRHPDIKPNYDASLSNDLNNPNDTNHDPQPTDNGDNTHGTRCAGEIVAVANNSICGVGVAYGAKIGGVRMLDGTITDLLEANAVTFNNQKIHIYSASWGPRDDGKTTEKPGPLCSQALKDGAEKGRGGLGSIFVWATGNGGANGDTCACDGYVSSIYTLSVGSISDKARSTYFSEICASTMVVTFTGGSHVPPSDRDFLSPKLNVITTDTNGGCTLNFQGTSSACPIAAGCMALVLEANPNLTWRDVQYLAALTARIPNDRTDGTWTVNGGGYHVNEVFGFGVLDCGLMVEKAQKWLNVGPQKICKIFPENGQNSSEIGAHSVKRLELFSDGCEGNISSRVDALEHVELHVDIESQHRGKLNIFLTSPQHMRVEMLRLRANDDSRAGLHFTLMSVQTWGEQPTGTWHLEIHNHDDQPATLQAWSATFYGTWRDPNNPSPDGVQGRNRSAVQNNDSRQSNENSKPHKNEKNDKISLLADKLKTLIQGSKSSFEKSSSSEFQRTGDLSEGGDRSAHRPNGEEIKKIMWKENEATVGVDRNLQKMKERKRTLNYLLNKLTQGGKETQHVNYRSRGQSDGRRGQMVDNKKRELQTSKLERRLNLLERLLEREALYQ